MKLKTQKVRRRGRGRSRGRRRKQQTSSAKWRDHPAPPQLQRRSHLFTYVSPDHFFEIDGVRQGLSYNTFTCFLTRKMSILFMLRDPANGTYFSRQEQHHGRRKYFFVFLNKSSGIYCEFSFKKKAYRAGLELKKKCLQRFT